MTDTVEKKTWGEKLWQEAEGRDTLAARALAWKSFEQTGLPSIRDEAWKYTATSFLTSHEFQFTALPKPDSVTLEHIRKKLEFFKSYARLVFIDGWYVPQISDLKPLSENIDFSSMREIASHRPDCIQTENLQGFAAMNAALFQDGVWLHVRPDAQPAVPLLIYFLQTASKSNQLAQVRNEISLGRNARLKIVEWQDHLQDQSFFWNQQTHIHLAQAANLEHVRLQQLGAETWLRSASEVEIEQEARYQRLDFEAGAKVSRNEIQVSFSGGQSFCGLNGIGLGTGAQHFDTQVNMNHAVPEAASDQVYRNLLSGKARGVFGGRVLVRPNAQKTDAHQVHKTLLLSEESRADTKPQLEIDADDVQCTHGAAIGQLNEDSLFYLRSRGISKTNAERMLAAGFVEKILDSISDESLRPFFKNQLDARLEAMFV